jgi:diadenosine tetraphosphatase ApaH/serine/threonine PP2A family protein phosphatase
VRYGFVADIHGNIDALKAILKSIYDDGNIDQMFCGGDIVGYGANPSECIALVRDLGWPVVAGNHDYAALGRMDLSYFNPLAKEAIEWTAEALLEEDRKWLEHLPLLQEGDSFTLVHGTLDRPDAFGYILSELDARTTLRILKKDFCFTGHSHYPCLFIEQENDLVFTRDEVATVDKLERALVNVGSVGQPRDGDPRACWIVFDVEARTVTTHRVPYDIEEAANKIIDAGLPEPLAERLYDGL